MDRTSPFNPLAGNPLHNRADVEAAMEALFAPLRGCFSPGGARVRVDWSGAMFDVAAAELEGFARPLWGIAAAASASADWALFRCGLVNGTDPRHPEYWGDVGPVDQRMVELAAIGFALRVARADLWDPIDAEAKARIAAYLTCARAQPFSNNNWKFFRLMIDLGLEEIGVAIDPALHDGYLDDIDSFYMTDGWYRDGPTRQLDHYIPFAFHFYGLLYAALARDRGERRATFIARASTFASQIEHWFADDGAALPFGRSLTYRFAAAGFWGALAFAGVEALPWGVIKGYYLRHLRWWSAQPMTRRDRLLPVGYAYPNALIAEDYNSPMSPYWAFKAFVPLALADDHPFWCAEEMPPRRADHATLTAAGMLVRHAPGHTVALSSGQSNPTIRHGPEKYAKFAYSTRYAFSIESDLRDPDRAVVDSSLALIDSEDSWRVRSSCDDARIGANMLWSRWTPWPNVTVETWLWWEGPWQMRAHVIDSGRALRTIEGGFAVTIDDMSTDIAAVSRPGMAIENGRDFSGIVDLSIPLREARSQRNAPNTNLVAARTCLPQLSGILPCGGGLLQSAVLAGPGTLDRVVWHHPPAGWSLASLRAQLPSMTRIAALAAPK